VRWAGCGEPQPEELDSMLISATILLDRLDKTKESSNNKKSAGLGSSDQSSDAS
jgi:hypothetical protein